jgi:hypothetical protein
VPIVYILEVQTYRREAGGLRKESIRGDEDAVIGKEGSADRRLKWTRRHGYYVYSFFVN